MLKWHAHLCYNKIAMPHRTLSLDEIRSAFRRCEEEPTMLSLRAVLSIGHEQIRDRGKLVAGRNATVAGG
ncbi:MAG: hypothetical protein C4320_09515, partial [Armatimonadota bacterium]